MRGAADIARRQRLNPPLTFQVLFRLEKGQTKNPKPEVLRALGKLYAKDYDTLVGIVAKAQHGVDLPKASDLPRHARTGEQALQGGIDATDPAEARIRELQNRVAELETYEAIVRQIRPHLASIVTLVGEESIDAARTKTRRRGGD